MSFDALLGNEQLKNDLAQSVRRGNLSHCYLISGPEGSGKHTLARLLAAAAQCTGERKPCLQCRPCRKVMEGNHPDFITVDDPEKKTITVDLVRQARSDVFILPNEGQRKIYLFPRAQDMRTEGQNALLKVLEEPPEYALFLLLSDNPEKLLPTVRSRCRELKLNALPQGILLEQLKKDFPDAAAEDLQAAAVRSGGFLGQARSLLEEGSRGNPQAESFAQGFLSGDVLTLAELLVPMEKWKRDALIPALEGWLQLLEEALVCRSGGQAITAQARNLAQNCSTARLYHGITRLQKAITYAQSNVSPGAVCGWLLWQLRA